MWTRRDLNKYGILKTILLVLVVSLILCLTWLYYSINYSTESIFRSSSSNVNYNDLKSSIFDIPSDIPLFKDTILNEKLIGFDNMGHTIYRINISHQSPNSPHLTLTDLYNYYKTNLKSKNWEITTDDKKLCVKFEHFCPEWLRIMAIKDNLQFTIFYINNIGYIQWHNQEISLNNLSITAPLDKNIIPKDFVIKNVLVQTENPDLIVYLETDKPLSIPPQDHQKLLINSGYSSCSSGSASHIYAYICTTANNSSDYFVNIVSSETYTFDIVTIRYTERVSS